MHKLYDLIHSPSALLAFEAAARHLSFTHAARELNVSQPAISAAVRKIEDALGVKLFSRQTRAISLTDAGERFFADVSFGLDHIIKSAEALRVQSYPEHVTVSCSMAFANFCLVPRLAAFKTELPDIELRMETSVRDSSLERDGLSLGIRRGNGDWQGYNSHFLTHEAIFPVCSPEYLRANGPIETLEDIRDHSLIHLEEPFRFRPTWTDFFASFGLKYKDKGAGLRMNEYALVVHAAIKGQGIAFGWNHITNQLVEEKILIRPVDKSYSQVNEFYLVWSDVSVLDPKVELVKKWLIKQFV